MQDKAAIYTNSLAYTENPVIGHKANSPTDTELRDVWRADALLLHYS